MGAHAGTDWVVYLAIALSGASALGAEVIWTRLCSLLLSGTIYTFSIILAVFLIGHRDRQRRRLDRSRAARPIRGARSA